jgi:hypothetical protein
MNYWTYLVALVSSIKVEPIFASVNNFRKPITFNEAHAKACIHTCAHTEVIYIVPNFGSVFSTALRSI